MKAIAMFAVKDFSHAGRTFAAGEVFECSPIEAASFRYRGVAKFAPLTRDLKADIPADDEPPTTKRRYRRRDIQAEP